MSKVYVVGVGMTRMGKLADSTVKSLTRHAVDAAISDAGLQASELDCAYFSNACQSHMDGQLMISGQLALRAMGIEGIPVINVENACASGSTAFNQAFQFIKSGQGDLALAVGAEKMFSSDRERMMSVFDAGWDITSVEQNKAQLLALGEGVEAPPGTTSEKPYSVFMDVYAAFSRFHMKKFGTTARQIAAVSAKNHTHSVHNEKAQYRNAYTVDDVLSAPPITYPLTLPMCAPISDGAAAAILTSEAGLKRLVNNKQRAVEVLATVLQTGSSRSADEVEEHLTAKAARRAYEIAGVGPQDISVAEVHDATAMGEIIQIENMGFFEYGEGGHAAESGATAIGGRIPVNPSGGLQSKGHPIGATGLGQIYELVGQLRGECGARQVENARLAMAENGGGLIGLEEAVASVLILARQER